MIDDQNTAPSSLNHSVTLIQPVKSAPEHPAFRQPLCFDTSTVSVVAGTVALIVALLLRNPWICGHSRSKSCESHIIVKHTNFLLCFSVFPQVEPHECFCSVHSFIQRRSSSSCLTCFSLSTNSSFCGLRCLLTFTWCIYCLLKRYRFLKDNPFKLNLYFVVKYCSWVYIMDDGNL